MLAGEFADLQHGEGGGIADRFIEMPGDAFDALQKIVRREFERVMLRADFARRLRRALCLGVGAAKADGESLHAPLKLLRVGDDGAAVEAAAEQHADGHVGAQVHLHGVAERGVERLDGGVEVGEVGLGGERVAPVFARLGGAEVGEREREEAAGGEFMNVPEMRARGGEREPGDVIGKGVGVALAADPREREETFQLGGKGEARAVAGVVERLLAEVVAREEQAVLPRVEEGEGEHAAQFSKHGVAVLFVQMHEDFGVALRAKNMACGEEVAAEFEVVVDFAVEDDADGFVLVPDGLPAAFEINDAEPPHAEREAGHGVQARAVRPAVGDEVEHPLQMRARIRGGRRRVDKAGDATHGCRALFSERRASRLGGKSGRAFCGKWQADGGGGEPAGV